MAKVSKLTASQKTQAKAYATKKWPGETVTVDDKFNGEGEVVFRRLKISTREVSDLPKAKKAKDLR